MGSTNSSSGISRVTEPLLSLRDDAERSSVSFQRFWDFASLALAAMVQRLSADWSAAYGHSLLLAETFVDPSRFSGHMYKAVGWTRLGRTKGYARANGRYTDPHGVPKDLHVFPLHRDTRSRMFAPDPLPDPLLPKSMGDASEQPPHRLCSLY